MITNIHRAAILLLTIVAAGKAQKNLVPNSSFDTVITCPTNNGQWDKCKGWNNVNMQTGFGLWGTPDFYHYCGSGNSVPPATFGGTCIPHSGVGMMGSVLYNTAYPEFREYLSTKLSSPMLPGNSYTVSFWITNGTGLRSPYIIKNVGIHFSQNPLTQTGYSTVAVTPQCEVTGYVSSNAWVQYTFVLVPTSTYSFLTIGSFRSDNANSPVYAYTVPITANAAYSHYFIDDVEVLFDDCSTSTTPISATGLHDLSRTIGAACSPGCCVLYLEHRRKFFKHYRVALGDHGLFRHRYGRAM